MTTSFFPAKPLGAYGDGGAVLTDDDWLAERIDSLRVHGKATKSDVEGHSFDHDPKYLNLRVGMNSRLDTMQAAILIEKLKVFADEIEWRNAAADRYTTAWPARAVRTPKVIRGGRSTWAQYTIEHPDRDGLMAHLKALDIPTAAYYPMPMHAQDCYARYPAPGGLAGQRGEGRRRAQPAHARRPRRRDPGRDRRRRARLQRLTRAGRAGKSPLGWPAAPLRGGAILATAAARRSFQTLDGLRGVGAAIIVMRHVPRLFWPLRVPESYLAVDLFYLVSGFVIAHAYGQRLAAGGYFWPFVKTRIIRLYPLYLIALVVGVVTATALCLQSPSSGWTPMKILGCFVVGLFMIPRFPGLPNNGTTLDGPLWTLLYELIANFVYAAIVRLLSIPVLLAIMLVSGAGVVLAEATAHTLDVGYNLTDQWAALARVGYSFFAGVLIYRLFGEKEQKAVWASWACAAALAVALAINLPHTLTAPYEVGMVLVGLPLIAIAAARFEPGPATGRFFTWVGLMSTASIACTSRWATSSASSSAACCPSACVWSRSGSSSSSRSMLLSWALDIVYDAAVRRWLRGLLFRERPRPAAAAPT